MPEVKVKYVRTEANFKNAEESRQRIYYSPLFFIIEKLGPGTQVNVWQRQVHRHQPSDYKLQGMIQPDVNKNDTRGDLLVDIYFHQLGDIARDTFAEAANAVTAYKYPPNRQIIVPSRFSATITTIPKKKKAKPKKETNGKPESS